MVFIVSGSSILIPEIHIYLENGLVIIIYCRLIHDFSCVRVGFC